jgi:hypothetical protein
VSCFVSFFCSWIFFNNIIHMYVNSLDEGNTSLFDILPSRKEFNVDQPNIHMTWQWTHSEEHLRMCEIVCWWKCRMCENRIEEEKKHWRILYENDTKKIIQQNTTKPEYA